MRDGDLLRPFQVDRVVDVAEFVEIGRLRRDRLPKSGVEGSAPFAGNWATMHLTNAKSEFMQAARDRPDSLEIEITRNMIEAGVKAYLGLATHDELSFATPSEVVQGVLTAALTRRQDLQRIDQAPARLEAHQ